MRRNEIRQTIYDKSPYRTKGPVGIKVKKLNEQIHVKKNKNNWQRKKILKRIASDEQREDERWKISAKCKKTETPDGYDRIILSLQLSG